MKTIYQILYKCLLIILAIQLLNMSFNNLNNFFGDDQSVTVSSNNQIDCAFEYITEHLLGWDNYIPENKARTDHQTNHLHKTSTVCWYVDVHLSALVLDNHLSGKDYPVQPSMVAKGYIGDINPPPPKEI